jgi:hypothetical protein
MSRMRVMSERIAATSSAKRRGQPKNRPVQVRRSDNRLHRPKIRCDMSKKRRAKEARNEPQIGIAPKLGRSRNQKLGQVAGEGVVHLCHCPERSRSLSALPSCCACRSSGCQEASPEAHDTRAKCSDKETTPESDDCTVILLTSQYSGCGFGFHEAGSQSGQLR